MKIKTYLLLLTILIPCSAYWIMWKCKSEETVGNTTITWEFSKYGHHQYVAFPHCINRSKKFVSKTCLFSGHFKEKTKCEEVQLNLKKCPDGFIAQNENCIIVLDEANNSESRCPFENILPFETHFIDFANLEPVWYPSKRAPESIIGEFVKEDLNIKYGETLESPVIYERGLAESNCSIFNGTDIVGVPCSIKYKRICVYKQLAKNQKSLCKMSFPKEICIDFDYNNSLLKCLCIAKRDHCKVAELIHPYQNSIISLTEESCLIGLHEDDGIIKWKTLNTSPNYTFWAKSPVKPIDNKFLLTRDGWIGSKSLITCKICEHRIDYKKPVLNIMKNGDDLIISVENPSNLVNIEGTYLHCFTNAHKQFLRHKFTPLGYNDKYNISKPESGMYWCEAFEMDNFKHMSTEKIWVHRKDEDVLVMEINVQYEMLEDPTHNSVAYAKYIHIIEDTLMSACDQITSVKWMDTIRIDEDLRLVDYLIHIYMKSNTFSYMNRGMLPTLTSLDFIKNTSKLFNIKFCTEEHVNILQRNVIWPITALNDSASSTPKCVDIFGNEIRRRCSGDFLKGARWTDIPRCQFTTSETTKDLTELLNSNASTPEVIEKLHGITSDTSKFSPVDVRIVSSILDKLEPGEGVSENVTRIISNVMTTNISTLTKSQSLMNATDNILYSYDDLLLRNKHFYFDEIIETPYLISFIFDANYTNHCGLKLIRSGNNFIIEKIERGEDIEALLNITDLEVATFIPSEVLDNVEDKKIIINIFLSQVLFNEENSSNHKVVARNFGILINNNDSFKDNITLIFSSEYHESECDCSFWHYGFDDKTAIKGKWSTTDKSELSESFLHTCHFDHVTHFGLLISDKIIVQNTSILDLITTLETCFSVLGFFGIFVTAGLFKTWRSSAGNRILIHYSIVSCAQIALLYISNIVQVTKNIGLCVVFGAGLHYTVLSQFCWMLVMAYLQYRRYVTVFYGMKKWMMTKFFMISYIVPILPVAVVMIFFKMNYVEGAAEICYPSGDGLMYGVLLPVLIIVCINLTIFLRIILEMFCLRKNKCIDDGTFLLRLRLVVLTFFMLGITWGFGIAAHLLRSAVLVYIFCVTASIQGFVIFLFFIVFNENARVMYVYMCKKYNYM